MLPSQIKKTTRTMLYSSLPPEDAGDILSITGKRRAFIAVDVPEVDHNFKTERADIFSMFRTKILIDFSV